MGGGPETGDRVGSNGGVLEVGGASEGGGGGALVGGDVRWTGGVLGGGAEIGGGGALLVGGGGALSVGGAEVGGALSRGGESEEVSLSGLGLGGGLVGWSVGGLWETEGDSCWNSDAARALTEPLPLSPDWFPSSDGMGLGCLDKGGLWV